ncbi:MAG: hypothetical protein QTN59_02230 [Candidatus Electrothrix communis]|nr:MAG: hypothetical protein QTN59_02230 [Candidatus Electrothrix communis]
MSLVNCSIAWIAFGVINYLIKFLKYNKDWKKEGSQVYFVAVLVSALIVGPIGLFFTLINPKGKPS